MGKSAHTVNSTDVFSTVLSTLTILSSVVIPPTIRINSILDTLMKDVGEILGLTRSSKHQELEEFGEYVDKMINRLVLGFRNDGLAQRTNVIKNLNELQRTLWMILRCISYIRGSEGMMSRIGHVLHPEEDQIPRMRQRLDDALKLFEFGAFIEMLVEQANPPTSAAGAYKAVSPADQCLARHTALPTQRPTTTLTSRDARLLKQPDNFGAVVHVLPLFN
ncbi:unnamed protein product [Rhizoctonia solani]|uniref:Uncharacterized protein n=1 Tax=Rhizoctonia solani TaxID=456999 RepID=A0A8H3H6E5_9AGAM|nr:unnamed protein product [Rhizoctonia solani]CAE6482792.1 unnamed protein product [Rhizoctonia solani]